MTILAISQLIVDEKTATTTSSCRRLAYRIAFSGVNIYHEGLAFGCPFSYLSDQLAQNGGQPFSQLIMHGGAGQAGGSGGF